MLLHLRLNAEEVLLSNDEIVDRQEESFTKAERSRGSSRRLDGAHAAVHECIRDRSCCFEQASRAAARFCSMQNYANMRHGQPPGSFYISQCSGVVCGAEKVDLTSSEWIKVHHFLEESGEEGISKACAG